MELVRGIKITDYCDQEQLSTRDRLDLFIKVCQAIQHAHQKGIIHRDIKPSNILVTLHDGVPVPKVIDFGIAKAVEGRLTDATVYTQLHQFIGTPAYMSPEQAEMSGLDIDTRSDIYSLGVLLYELLTGVTPFDAKELMSQRGAMGSRGNGVKHRHSTILATAEDSDASRRVDGPMRCTAGILGSHYPLLDAVCARDCRRAASLTHPAICRTLAL
jgi:serine/threonine protein kinase